MHNNFEPFAGYAVAVAVAVGFDCGSHNAWQFVAERIEGAAFSMDSKQVTASDEPDFGGKIVIRLYHDRVCHLPVIRFAYWASTSLVRDCRPGPPLRKKSTTSRGSRSVT